MYSYYLYSFLLRIGVLEKARKYTVNQGCFRLCLDVWLFVRQKNKNVEYLIVTIDDVINEVKLGELTAGRCQCIRNREQ